jgi:hypothetical protein
MTDKYKNIFHTLILFALIFFLLHSKILSNFVWTFPELFMDFKGPINWLECHSLGFNLITLESVDCGLGERIGQFNYGYAFLNIPYNEFLGIFYRTYLPWIFIFLFVFFSVVIFSPKDKSETFLLYLALLNPSTMLLFERMQLDCLFYLAIIFAVYNRYYFIHWFLGIYFALIKFYPIAILISIFVEKKDRSLKFIFFIILFLSCLFFSYLFINKEYYLFMINNMLPGKAGYHFLYSLNSLPKILTYSFAIKYQILLILFYSLFILISIKIYKKLSVDQNFILNELYTDKSKLYLIAGYFNLFLFTLVSSYAYKEVYLILFIPFILHVKEKYNNKIFNILIYILIVRYIYLFLYAYINVHDDITFIDAQRVFSYKFLITIFFKAILDFILISFITAILFLKTKFYIFDKINNK